MTGNYRVEPKREAVPDLENMQFATMVMPGVMAERYSGRSEPGAAGWDARADRSMAMAAYAMTPVTTQRISVR